MRAGNERQRGKRQKADTKGEEDKSWEKERWRTRGQGRGGLERKQPAQGPPIHRSCQSQRQCTPFLLFSFSPFREGGGGPGEGEREGGAGRERRVNSEKYRKEIQFQGRSIKGPLSRLALKPTGEGSLPGEGGAGARAGDHQLHVRSAPLPWPRPPARGCLPGDLGEPGGDAVGKAWFPGPVQGALGARAMDGGGLGWAALSSDCSGKPGCRPGWGTRGQGRGGRAGPCPWGH